MTHSLRVALVAALGLGLAGCPDAPETPQPFFPLDAPTTWPVVRKCRHASPDHSEAQAIQVFAAPDTKDDYLAQVSQFKPGARLVKGEYEDQDCKILLRFTAMRKAASGEAAGVGGWQWQKVATDGTVLDPGKGCGSCHAASCAAKDHACTDP